MKEKFSKLAERAYLYVFPPNITLFLLRNFQQDRGLSVQETVDKEEEGVSVGGNASHMILCPWGLSRRAWPPKNSAFSWRKLSWQVREWLGRSCLGFTLLMGHQEALSTSLKWQQAQMVWASDSSDHKAPWILTVCLQQVSPVPVSSEKPIAVSLSPTHSCLTDCPSQGDKTLVNHLWFGSACHLQADTMTAQGEHFSHLSLCNRQCWHKACRC